MSHPPRRARALCLALATGFLATSAHATGSATSAPNDLSFTEQCPKLLAMADDFARECLSSAKTKSFTPASLAGRRGHTLSSIMYFRPATPQSHFSLGCVLNNHDRRKFDYFGVYYAAKDANFAIANTDDSQWRNIDQFGGNVGLIAHGEPLNLVMVRPLDTGHLSFSDEGFGMHYLLGQTGRVKNCEPVTSADSAGVYNVKHVKRTNKGGATTIVACTGPTCDESALRIAEALPKNTQRGIDGNFLDGPADFTPFFDTGDHELIYRNLGFYIESGGGLLLRNDILQADCHGLSYYMRGTHYGTLTIPDIAREVCNVPHQP